jgi:two-component system, NarL family, response regulator NreC
MAVLRLAPAPPHEAREISAQHPIRVVLADDHAFMRRGLRLLLEGEDGLEVIAEAEDLCSASEHVRRDRPAVLVLDLRMPGGSGIETISRLRAEVPETQIVALTMEADRRFAQKALYSGALGFVLKDLADSELPGAIRAAARGEQYVSPRVAVHRRR